jgi:hypothetical protein
MMADSIKSLPWKRRARPDGVARTFVLLAAAGLIVSVASVLFSLN